MTNEELQSHVADELHWDPKVDSAAIAVTVDDGAVTLRGTVGSFREKREAKADAERVYGVKNVKNNLEVRILTEDRRDDADIRGAVLQALTLDSTVPADIEATVVDGWVTLTGTVTWKFQYDEAESVASNISGVVAVDNLIEIVPPGPSTEDLQHSIKKAMERNAKLDAKGVKVESSKGTVKLSGTVSSWADHDAAVDAAWSAPGVRDVTDHILVAY
jgi:osmotically-inducible protein OsmY